MFWTKIKDYILNQTENQKWKILKEEKIIASENQHQYEWNTLQINYGKWHGKLRGRGKINSLHEKPKTFPLWKTFNENEKKKIKKIAIHTNLFSLLKELKMAFLNAKTKKHEEDSWKLITEILKINEKIQKERLEETSNTIWEQDYEKWESAWIYTKVIDFLINIQDKYEEILNALIKTKKYIFYKKQWKERQQKLTERINELTKILKINLTRETPNWKEEYKSKRETLIKQGQDYEKINVTKAFIEKWTKEQKQENLELKRIIKNIKNKYP